MFAIDGLILSISLLLILAIVSSKFSTRVGVPLLVLFIGLGMITGTDGLGLIDFDDYTLAHGIGTAALVLILFDGGLRTPLASFRTALAPALVLATAGVLLTAIITGLAAARMFGLTLLEGVLLGSILGSTDAAAVFAALRGQRLRLQQRVGATLEVESGSNDPMAVFLTIGLIEVLLGRMELGGGLVLLFIRQMGLGAIIGLLVGRAAAALNLRVNLAAAGLYPVLMAAAGFLAYGAAAALGGSGFLAAYLAGIVIGNRRIVFERGIYLFNDGMAWLAQLVMFIMLGLLTFPSRLVDVAPAGLALAAVLVLVARPIAVAATMYPFGFNTREVAFLSWAGLKGAVPIILGIFPLLFGVPRGELIFDLVFFAVLVSALAQGWSLPLVARRLGLEQPGQPEPPVTLEITSLRDVDGDIVEYTVAPTSRAAGRLIRELALPDGAVVAMITRGEDIIPPRGSTRVEAGDHVFLVMRAAVRTLVDRAFAGDARARPGPLTDVEFPLFAATTVGDLAEFYGIDLASPPDQTLAAVLLERLEGAAPAPGARVDIPGASLIIREMAGGEIVLVGLSLPALHDTT